MRNLMTILVLAGSLLLAAPLFADDAEQGAEESAPPVEAAPPASADSPESPEAPSESEGESE